MPGTRKWTDGNWGVCTDVKWMAPALALAGAGASPSGRTTGSQVDNCRYPEDRTFSLGTAGVNIYEVVWHRIERM